MATRDERRKVKAAVSGPTCVRAVLLTYRDGGVRPMVVPCGRWACLNCSEWKVNEVLEHLKSASGGGDLFDAALPKDKWDPARKMAMRKGAGYVSFKRFDGSVLLVSDEPLKGRNWRLKPTTPDALAEAILKQNVRRVDWCADWRPVKPETHQTVGRASLPAGWAADVLARAGYDQAKGRIPGLDAYETVERLNDAAAQIATEKSLVRGREPEREKSLVRGRT